MNEGVISMLRRFLICLIACIASIAGAQDRTRSAEDWLDHLAPSGVDTPRTLVSGDFMPALRTVSAPPGACSTGEIHALDFLIGDWESATSDLVNDAGTHGHGRNHIEPLLGGCAIMQHRSEESDGKKLFDSYVIWAFDNAQNRIREFVIDDNQHAQVYEGMWEDGAWVFYRDRISDDGNVWMLRVRYAKSANGFTQTADLTKNRGKTWEKATTTSYIRATK
jgi:hypothetical protein